MPTTFTSLRVKGTYYVGGLVTAAAGLALTGVLNFSGSTGVVLQQGGVTQQQIFNTACTNTGGLAKYATCIVASPLTTTGALESISLECGNTYKALSMSGGFVKTQTAAVASAFPTLRTISVGTGAYNVFNTAATSGSYVLWNPADSIKFQTVTTMPSSSIDCTVHVELHDKAGT